MEEHILVCDVGVKNFCYTVFKQNQLIEFDILAITDKKLLDLFVNLHKQYNFKYIGCEKQHNRNPKCIRYSHYIIAFSILNKIQYRMINPRNKFTVLSVDKEDITTYYQRKKLATLLGQENLKKFSFSDEIQKQINQLTKTDDFYDCLLMYLTTFITPTKPENTKEETGLLENEKHTRIFKFV
uniref:Mitochondrial resolvase Ydc2 catalytic domain-containing protein n=1 Tax=viral metagenome TaxID=1070528 RepID=A0A6C0J895_9ZZZZ